MADASSSNAYPHKSAAASSPLSDRRVLVALCGGIACYKTATLVSQLVQRGAQVQVLMTQAATRFITPLTMAALSGRPVLSSIWESDNQAQVQHIDLARWAELMVIAPASANTIARICAGLCDDIVSLVAAALPRTAQHKTQLLVAPAMNADMWDSPITQQNVANLKNTLGAHTIGPEEGWQACRSSGPGRMTEPEAILARIESLLAEVRR